MKPFRLPFALLLTSLSLEGSDWNVFPDQASSSAKEIELARGERSSGDIDSAMTRLGRLLEEDPRNAEALGELGICHLWSNRLEDAKASLGKALELNPSLLCPYLGLAEVLSQEQDLSGARQVLVRASLVHPESSEPHFALAKILFRIGRVMGAEQAARRALALDHEAVPEIHLLLASIFRTQGKTVEETEQLEAYLVDVPEGEQADRARAGLGDARRRAQGAVVSVAVPYWGLVQRYAEGEFTEAASALSGLPRTSVLAEMDSANRTRFSDDQLLSAAMLHTEAALFADNDRSFHFRQAIGYLTRLSDRARGEGFQRRWYLAMGWFHIERYRYMVAIPFLDEGLHLFRRDPDIRLSLACACEGAALIGGHVNELLLGESLLRELVDDEPDHIDARLRLGHVLKLKGWDEEALGHLQWVVESTSQKDAVVVARLLIGDIWRARGESGRAIEAYRRALAADPGCQSAVTALSHALHRAGDRDEARRVLEVFLGQQESSSEKTDTWWRYLRGGADRFDSMMRELREEIVS